MSNPNFIFPNSSLCFLLYSYKRFWRTKEKIFTFNWLRAGAEKEAINLYTELKERITPPSYDRYHLLILCVIPAFQSFLKDFRRRKLKATFSRLLHQLKGGEKEEAWVTCDSCCQMCGHQQASSTWRVFLAPLNSSWVLSTSVSMPVRSLTEASWGFLDSSWK